jgi:hypothetical protein
VENALTTRVAANVFHRFMRSGRTAPVLLGCQREEDNEEVDYVVKTIGGCDFGIGQLVKEFAVAQLADYFDLAHPRQALVEIGDDLAELIAGEVPEKAEAIRRSVGLNFGSEMLHNLIVWPVDRQPSASQLGQASLIFAFDVLIQNPDRRFDNPNLGVVGDRIYIFDHEMAFSSQYELFKRGEPWQIANDDSLTRHVFFNQLRRQAIDVGDFFERLAQFPDDFFSRLEDELPENWENQTLHYIANQLSLMAQNSEQFREELLRRLA